MQRITKQQIVGFVGWMLVVFVAALLGAAASINANTFYTELSRPEWAPPAYVFGPVWTVLYILMGISAWLIWRAKGFRTFHPALILFITQLVLNALWSWLFFKWHLGIFAFVDIIFLWILIVVMVVWFWRITPFAGILLIPYLLWVSFATLLCFTVWQLNPQALGT